MNEELQKELDHDMEFIDKVHERIYSESDDSFNEPEWIIDMTEIANRYLMRFKMAEIGRRNAIKLLDDAKMSISKLQKEVHENAVEHGWWDEDREFGTLISLCHSELSEALEEVRSGRDMNKTYYTDGNMEGVPSELADVVIRVMDICGKYDIDLEKAIIEKHEVNKSRPVKHGKTF